MNRDLAVSVCEYLDLVRRVAKVDEEAAAWMLSEECLMMDRMHFSDCISTCFPWDKTPQGCMYWERVLRSIRNLSVSRDKQGGTR
jgi:hypothetical protein